MSRKCFWAAVCSTVWICAPVFAQATKLSTADKQFLKTAAIENMTQAHLGQMAEQQASEDSVKTLGKTLDQDYTHSYTELTGVAQKEGETIPTGINIQRDRDIEQLSHMKGASFDRSFVRQEIREDQRALSEYKREAQHGENPEIKSYAQQMIPTIQNHLTEAESLSKSGKHA